MFIYTFFFVGCCSDNKKKHPAQERNIWHPQSLPYPTTYWHWKMQNSHENRRSNPWACTPTKTHIQLVSIKVLFPQNQCKSLFRKFTTKSMKIYTSQYNKNVIHNLSNHTLTEDELSVLPKGLSFVLTPTKTFKQETNKSWNKFKTRMLTQYFFFATKFMINHPLLKGNPAGHLLPWTTPP